jgi:hypothetical protein
LHQIQVYSGEELVLCLSYQLPPLLVPEP